MTRGRGSFLAVETAPLKERVAAKLAAAQHMQTDPVFDRRESAVILNCHTRTIINMQSDGRLQSVSPSKGTRGAPMHQLQTFTPRHLAAGVVCDFFSKELGFDAADCAIIHQAIIEAPKMLSRMWLVEYLPDGRDGKPNSEAGTVLDVLTNDAVRRLKRSREVIQHETLEMWVDVLLAEISQGRVASSSKEPVCWERLEDEREGAA